MHFRGVLLDLDGTLVNSLDFVEASWSLWARQKGLDPRTVCHYLHGKPALSTLRHFMPGASEQTIQDEFLALEDYEASHTDGITAVNGAVDFLRQLERNRVPWAIVTSGSLKVASARIRQAGFPMPPVLVTSEDIQQGKPRPEPFLIGAARLDVSPARCIAFEDSTAGLLSASGAGCVVVEVLTRQSVVHDIDSWQTINRYAGLSVTQKGETEFFLTIQREC
ncbi:HAD-IA family hydrolase [Erwinia sp. INIA-01]|uniref:HAD-IA family hydrolase n=1 Tax=Erwinia sp. INIA01 TaxID=2991500 RepID=UPI002224CDDF|nr:HAD-IA family hydrolase [Erwinia sp. INIA01]MCW1874426.1 HAD-IA family hydrolase [Erwinia sp. INIA01]